MVYSVDKVSEVRREKPLKDNDKGNEEECSASKKSKQGQGQGEGLELQDKIWKNQEGCTSGSSGKEDEKQEKDVSRSDEDLNSEEDKQKRQGSCEEEEMDILGQEMDTLEQVETQQRQHGAGHTLGTSLEESVGFCPNDSNRDPTVDDEGEKGNIVHQGEDDNQNDEQDGALEKVEPLEWMFTRREVEKGTVEIVYRWLNLFLAISYPDS